MWISDLSDSRAIKVLGPRAAEIRAYTAELKAGVRPAMRPSSLDADDYEEALRLFGPNGPSVRLFLKSWESIPWRSREGLPHPADGDVTRVYHWQEALGPTKSPAWERALEDAGYQSRDPILSRVWTAGAKVGFGIGGYHASFLSGAAAAELAQMPARDAHWFLEMMPWIRGGHWPCGWDDDRRRLKVF